MEQQENSAIVRKAEYDLGLSAVRLAWRTQGASSSHTALSWHCRGASDKVIQTQTWHKIWVPQQTGASSAVPGVFKSDWKAISCQTEFSSAVIQEQYLQFILCLKPTQFSKNRWQNVKSLPLWFISWVSLQLSERQQVYCSLPALPLYFEASGKIPNHFLGLDLG